MPAIEVTETLTLPDVAAWRAWLDAHEEVADGVWLVIAKKGTTTPTTLTIEQALDEALCSGWIDGQRKGRDATTFLQRYTPRRRASLWSARNVGYVARLEAEGRMRERGRAEIERAQADGRWDRAYEGSAKIEVPASLAAALAASPEATATFESLGRTDRFSVLHRVVTATSPEVEARRIARLIATLASGSAP